LMAAQVCCSSIHDGPSVPPQPGKPAESRILPSQPLPESSANVTYEFPLPELIFTNYKPLQHSLRLSVRPLNWKTATILSTEVSVTNSGSVPTEVCAAYNSIYFFEGADKPFWFYAAFPSFCWRRLDLTRGATSAWIQDVVFPEPGMFDRQVCMDLEIIDPEHCNAVECVAATISATFRPSSPPQN